MSNINPIMNKRSIANIINLPKPHWVGDGFKVCGFIPQKITWDRISQFVMCDYAASQYF